MRAGGLSDSLVSDFRMNPSFRLRPTGFDNAEGLSRLTWSNIARCYGSSDQYNCSTRRNGVAYSTPDFKGMFEGFNAQWGYFEDDDWSAALRYKNSFSLWGDGAGASGDDAWLFTANVAYENLRDERLQAGGGGEATGVVPIPQQFPPPSTRNKTTFFERNFDEWAGSVGLCAARRLRSLLHRWPHLFLRLPPCQCGNSIDLAKSQIRLPCSNGSCTRRIYGYPKYRRARKDTS